MNFKEKMPQMSIHDENVNVLSFLSVQALAQSVPLSVPSKSPREQG